MPKYLIIDSALLESKVISNNDITNDDLIFRSAQNTNTGLKNGVHIVNTLNALINHYGYQIILNSEDPISYNYSNSLQLQRVCKIKGLDIPKIRAIVEYFRSDKRSSNQPSIMKIAMETPDNTELITWGNDKLPNKKSLRCALEAAKSLNINETNRQHHIVFDSNEANLKTFKAAGYQTHLINDEVSLGDALNCVLENLKKAPEELLYENDNSYVNAIQQLNAYINPESPKKYNFWTKINHKRNVEIAKKLLENIENRNISKDTVFKSKCTPWHHIIRSKTLKDIFQETEAQYKVDYPQKSIFDCFK